jgi:hypothetical protein
VLDLYSVAIHTMAILAAVQGKAILNKDLPCLGWVKHFVLGIINGGGTFFIEKIERFNWIYFV